jgi:uncharacterized protein (DUF488 family)
LIAGRVGKATPADAPEITRVLGELGHRSPGTGVAYSDVPIIDPDERTETPRIATIGVYEFTAVTFLDTLTDAGVGLLLDIRQRRGVRGRDYSWANSARLQHALAAAHISYRHEKRLAPTTELRQLQYREDDRHGVGKRNRAVLASDYAERYVREILDSFDLGALVAELPTNSATALLCVERDPKACHRSLVAARLRLEHGLPVTDLRPS